MNSEEMSQFLGMVKENYRFTTKLDMEILGRVAAPLALQQAEAILTTVRSEDKDPTQVDIPAFTARARAAIEHANIKPSMPRRLVDWVRKEMGDDTTDAASAVMRYFEKAWKDLKEQPESPWRNRMRGMLLRQIKTALMELDWSDADADDVAHQIVEIPMSEAT